MPHQLRRNDRSGRRRNVSEPRIHQRIFHPFLGRSSTRAKRREKRRRGRGKQEKKKKKKGKKKKRGRKKRKRKEGKKETRGGERERGSEAEKRRKETLVSRRNANRGLVTSILMREPFRPGRDRVKRTSETHPFDISDAIKIARSCWSLISLLACFCVARNGDVWRP